MSRSRIVVAVFLAIQLLIPARGLYLRWTGEAEYSRFSWQMYSTAP